MSASRDSHVATNEAEILPLPEGVKSAYVRVNDLIMHVLDAQPASSPSSGAAQAPLVLLLHGFPELGFSWRFILPLLAAAGYRAVAPDQRGFGSTGPASVPYSADTRPYSLLSHARNAVALVHALGYSRAACVVGHDLGSPVAGMCALVRPDMFNGVVMMSAPFTGAPEPPSGQPLYSSRSEAEAALAGAQEGSLMDILDRMFAGMDPPRQHYVQYYASEGADSDMHLPLQELRRFLRAYFHIKSGDWALASGHNRKPGSSGVIPCPSPPTPLADISPVEAARLPISYLLPRDRNMPDAIADHHPSPNELETKSYRWLDERALDVYAKAYAHTGFQGGLNWYRNAIDPNATSELALFNGAKVQVPALFVAGALDWGVHQTPGALARMRVVCPHMGEDGVVLIPGAGHWIQQERSKDVFDVLKGFLEKLDHGGRAWGRA